MRECPPTPLPPSRRYNLSKSRNFTDVLRWGYKLISYPDLTLFYLSLGRGRSGYEIRYKLAPHPTKVCKFPQFWGAVFARLRRIPSKYDNFINFKAFPLVSTDFPKLVHIKSFTNNTRENRPIRRVVIRRRLFFSSGSLKICFSSCLVCSLDLLQVHFDWAYVCFLDLVAQSCGQLVNCPNLRHF